MNIPETTVLDEKWMDMWSVAHRRPAGDSRSDHYFYHSYSFCAYLYALDGQRRESRSEDYEDRRHK